MRTLLDCFGNAKSNVWHRRTKRKVASLGLGNSRPGEMAIQLRRSADHPLLGNYRVLVALERWSGNHWDVWHWHCRMVKI